MAARFGSLIVNVANTWEAQIKRKQSKTAILRVPLSFASKTSRPRRQIHRPKRFAAFELDVPSDDESSGSASDDDMAEEN